MIITKTNSSCPVFLNRTKEIVKWLYPRNTATVILDLQIDFKGQSDLEESFINNNYSYLIEPYRTQLQSNQAILCINCAAEAWVDHYMISLINNFVIRNLGPNTKAVYITNAANAQELAETIKSQSSNLHMFSVDFFLRKNHSKLYPKRQISELESPGPLLKTFTCYNYNQHDHRLLFYTLMHRADLVKDSWYSMPAYGYRGKFIPAMEFVLEHNKATELNIDSSTILSAAQSLPLVLEPNFSRKIQDDNNLTPYHFNTSMVSLITETFFYRKEIHITEKTVKPLHLRHPFILLASSGTLEYLRKLGFKTFSKFWNEKYDQELDDNKRMQMVLNLAMELHNWSTNQKQDFRHAVLDILTHNQQLAQQLANDHDRTRRTFARSFGLA